MATMQFRGLFVASLTCAGVAVLLAAGCGGDEFTSDAGGAGTETGGIGGNGNAAGTSGAETGGAGGGETGGGAGTGGTGGDPVGGTGGGAGEGTSGTGGAGGEPVGGTGGGAGEGTSGTGGGGTAGSGAAGSGATGGSTGGTGAAGSGGTGGGDEDCLNGVDDNGDHLVDCEDPLCEAFTCVPRPPDGWSAIGWLTSDGGGECPAGYPSHTDLYEFFDLAYAPAECDCSCGGPTGMGCVSDLRCSADASCANSAGSGIAVGQSCFETSLPGGSGGADTYCSASAPRVVGGECAPVGGIGLEPHSWPSAGRACTRGEGGACESGALCVPRPGPDLIGPCVARFGGTYNCPQQYPNQEQYFDGGVADTRGCTACTCGPPEGGYCACGSDPGQDCTVVLHERMCGGPLWGTVTTNGLDCPGFTPPAAGDTSTGAILTGATADAANAYCAAATSTPTGSVQPTGVLTVCCVDSAVVTPAGP